MSSIVGRPAICMGRNMKNVLEYLEQTVRTYPEKIAVRDDKNSCTYYELEQRAKEIGTYLSKVTKRGRPIAVFMEKSVETLQAFLGIVYSGGFYTLIDPEFPAQRIEQILDILKPEAVITNIENIIKIREIGYTKCIVDISEIGQETDSDKLNGIRAASIDTAPLYCNFTSGSTGTPKGVLVCHRSVIDFIDNFTEIFNITEQDVIGNQAPFDFDVSVKDIYSCLKTGASLVIIPKSFFMFPKKVIDMLEDNRVTTLIWAVSALCLVNRLHGLQYKIPAHINKILFSGEMMPVNQLNEWREYYKEALFVNLYGPTEITCNCTYHMIDRRYSPQEKIPIGKAFPNELVFLLDENDNEIPDTAPYKSGEICVAGTALALGYYNNRTMTEKSFICNPVNKSYPEIIYRTGDLAYYGENGELYFAGRKDFQIKHMGHRIELEEIETALLSIPMVFQTCCFFDEEKKKLVAYYAGDVDKRQIIDEMKQKVPVYMIPNTFVQTEVFPITRNGKTDRNAIRKLYEKR